MKANKTICLDVKVIEKLRDSNASELINNLLIDYFKEDKLEIIKEEIENVGDKIKVLQEKENKIKEENSKIKKMENIILDDRLKNWFIKKTERPSIIEVDTFLSTYQIERTMTIQNFLEKWDELHELD